MGKLDAKPAKAGKFFKSAAKKVAENPSQGGEWEDGRYAVQVTGCNINESQASGRLQVSFRLKGVEGEYKGQTIGHHQGIENEQGQEFLFRDFAELSFQAPENPDELEALCAKIEKKKPKARILVKTKGEYQNVRFLGLLSGEEAEDAAEEREEVASEEEESGEAELKEGSKVEVTLKSGATVQGTVLEVLEDEGKVRVEDEDGKKYKVNPDQIALLETEEVPEEPTEEESEEETEEESEEEEEEKPKGKAKVTKPTGKLKKK